MLPGLGGGHYDGGFKRRDVNKYEGGTRVGLSEVSSDEKAGTIRSPVFIRLERVA